MLKGTCHTGKFKTNIRRKSVSDEIERVKGCDCLHSPNNERFISGFQVFVNYHQKKYILRLFRFSLWFCITITIVISFLLWFNMTEEGRGLSLTVGKQCGNSVVIRIVIAQWRDLVRCGRVFFALEYSLYFLAMLSIFLFFFLLCDWRSGGRVPLMC